MGGRGASYISSVPRERYRYFTPEPQKSYHSYLGNYDVDVIKVKGVGYYSRPQTVYLDRKKRLDVEEKKYAIKKPEYAIIKQTKTKVIYNYSKIIGQSYF